jgi:hypothetical protein
MKVRRDTNGQGGYRSERLDKNNDFIVTEPAQLPVELFAAQNDLVMGLSLGVLASEGMSAHPQREH